MKKAKRLLAIILAVIMIAGGACLPVYARNGGAGSSSDYTQINYDSAGKVYFTAEQGATYLLDLVDNLLADKQICLDLVDVIGDTGLWALNLKKAGGSYKDYGSDGKVYLTSVDNAILEIEQLLSQVDSGAVSEVGSGLLKDVKKILGSHNALSTQVLRGTHPLYQNGSNDIDVLYNVLNWVRSIQEHLVNLVKGQFDLGVVGDFLPDNVMAIVNDLPGFLKDTIYSALIDSAASTRPSGTTVDAALQQLVDWALISGTGVTPETGSNSVLGENFEAFLPEIASQPGRANIGSIAIKSDQNCDGVAEDTTMSFYQFVANAIQALLNGMLKNLLRDLLIDSLDINPAVNGGKGDVDIMSDPMFNTIISVIETLCTMNGAPPVDYTVHEGADTYPIPKLDCLLDWFFKPNGGLATLIRIDFRGIWITDNFMSLLNDVARMAPGLIGNLLGLDLPESIVYKTSELNEVKYVNSNYEICSEDDEDAQGMSYISYEKDANGNHYELFATEFDVDGKTPTRYAFVGSGAPANTITPGEADYINPTFIRNNYVISTSQVWACLLKVLLSGFIDGCYFPEWADSIPSAGAYALASLASKILPEENFFERLDRYHYEVELGETYHFVNTDKQYDALPYEVVANDPTGLVPATVIPKAALDIGASIGAYYLNGVFDFNGEYLTTHYTSLEQFAFEFLVWGFKKYLPVLAGNYNSNSGTFTGGAFSSQLNTCLSQVYSNLVTREYRPDANFNSIYTLLNQTIFGLVPAEWLPAEYNGSFAFVNSWLLNSVNGLDIQKLLGIFSVNTNKTTELYSSVTKVLLNIVARVLGLVFGGYPILPINNAADIFKPRVSTSVNSFEELLSKDPLATLLNNLLNAIWEKGRILLATVLPLVLSSQIVPPYDSTVLGKNLNTYKIADLIAYTDVLSRNVNSERVMGDVIFEREIKAREASEALDLPYTEVPQENGLTYYKIVYPDHFTSERKANAAARFVTDGYVSTEEATDGSEIYYICKGKDYLQCATRSADLTDDAGKYAIYSNFSIATLGARSSMNPFPVYSDGYIMHEAEDLSSRSLYVHNNFEDAVKDAKEFTSDYKKLAYETLPNAYADWFRFSIQCRLYQNNIYDGNGDGVQDMNADGTTKSTPSIPSSMYPYSTTANVPWGYYNDSIQGVIGRETWCNMMAFEPGDYEVIAMAVEFGNNPENNVVLPDNQVEEIVKLALNTLSFDITPDASGAYNQGSLQWNGLSADQIATINSFCVANDLQFTSTENGGYSISRKAFAQITDSKFAYCSNVGVRPTVSSKKDTFELKANSQICKSYDEFVKTMFNTRAELYSKLDQLGVRLVAAENNRKTTVDITMLKWVKAYTQSAYIDPISNLRNRKQAGVVNGEIQYTKIYTSESYRKFREAYDFANSLLSNAVAGATLTQSLVSKAYMGVLKAFQNLKPFTGEADWAQLERYIGIAQNMVNLYDPNDDYGYTEASYNRLFAELNKAITMRDESGYDCESQHLIDGESNDLYTALNEIAYKVTPRIVEAEGSPLRIEIISEGSRVVGQVYNLTEGVGLTKDMVRLVGMYEDDTSGKSFGVKSTARGNGTGASYQALDGVYTRFQFFAVLFGDINGDTRIDGTDKAAVDYYIITGKNNSSDMGNQRFEAADVDRDGDVDAIDSQLIEDHYNYKSVISQERISTDA